MSPLIVGRLDVVAWGLKMHFRTMGYLILCKLFAISKRYAYDETVCEMENVFILWCLQLMGSLAATTLYKLLGYAFV